MKIFAIIKDTVVVNKIIADSKELAETLTGLLGVEIEDPRVCEIGSSYVNNEFRDPAPYASWTYSEELNEWVAPVAKPEDENFYVWSEADLNWTRVTE
jgi:hypothetical protein